MQDELAVAEGAPLSQVARVVDTFVAPSKTFTDILRHGAMCWLPIVLIFLMTVGWSYAIDKKIGFAAVSEQQMSQSPKQEEAMQQLPPDQRAQRMSLTANITKYSTYCSIVFFLIFVAIEALVFWASFNFGLGATTRYPQVFAVVVFSALPRSLMWVLSAILIFAGVGLDNFNLRNPVGTNLGYYLTDSPQWMKTAGAFFDVFGFWSMALLIIGMAIISRKKISQSATVIIGWWLLILLIATGASAAFS